MGIFSIFMLFVEISNTAFFPQFFLLLYGFFRFFILCIQKRMVISDFLLFFTDFAADTPFYSILFRASFHDAFTPDFPRFSCSQSLFHLNFPSFGLYFDLKLFFFHISVLLLFSVLHSPSFFPIFLSFPFSPPSNCNFSSFSSLSARFTRLRLSSLFFSLLNLQRTSPFLILIAFLLPRRCVESFSLQINS